MDSEKLQGVNYLWIASLIISFIPAVSAGWQTGITSSYYGGQGDGGTCGYGKTSVSPYYGLYTASVSGALFGNGAECGACYAVQCFGSRFCRPNKLIVATVTNLCPQQSSGNHCDGQAKHFSLAPAVWNQISKNPNVGSIPVRVSRSWCSKKGGVVFKVEGNPYYMTLLPMNVAGSGDLSAVEVSLAGGPWLAMQRSYGAVWQLAGTLLTGKVISVRLTSRAYNQKLVFANAIPGSWAPGRTVRTLKNFLRPVRKPRKLMDVVVNATLSLNV